MPNEKPVWNHNEIIRPYLVIVEGRDDENLVGCLVDHLGLANIQIMRTEGDSSYSAKIRSVIRTRGFNNVRVLGLVRDADGNGRAKFQSICDVLHQAGFATPSTVSVRTGNDPEVCIFIVPELDGTGKIESCCLESVDNEPAMSCVDDYMMCLSQVGSNPRDSIKSKLHAFLASRDKPGLKLGEAARAGYFGFSHSAFDDLKNFLQVMVS